MNKSVKVSVLVPVYNVERYLGECLDSLVGQSLKEIEIICINDGSTDGSGEILRKYAERDERILVVTKKNTGYGDSMNVGLSRARGEYVGIVEPDDFADFGMFEQLYKAAKESDADVAKSNFYEYKTGKGDVYKSELFLEDEVGFLLDTLEHRHIFYQQPSIWSAIYRREFLVKNGIQFLPSAGASYQDAGFNFKVFAMARKVCFLDAAFLHYRKDNPDSSVKSDGKVLAVKEEYDAVEKYLEEHNLMHDFGETLAIVRMGGYIWNLRRLTREKASEFAKVMEADILRYRKMGYFKNSANLDPDAKFIVENLAVRDPVKFVKRLPVYEVREKILTTAHRVKRKLCG